MTCWPSFTRANHAHGRLTNPVHPAKFSLASEIGSLPDLFNLCCGQVLVSNMSTFSRHVLHVVGLCSQEKMVWIKTDWIVAAMKDEQTFGNVPAKKLPGQSMDDMISSFVADSTIAKAKGATSPLPAASNNVLLCLPHEFTERVRWGPTLTRAESSRGCRMGKGFVAGFTGIVVGHVGLLDGLRARAGGCLRTLRPPHYTTGGASGG